jgi:hypothetical protein
MSTLLSSAVPALIALAVFGSAGTALAAEPAAAKPPPPGIDASPSLKIARSPSVALKPDGFLSRWLVLEPIPGDGRVTESAIRAAAEKTYFADQLAVLPRAGDTVTVGEGRYAWHAVDSSRHNVNLYHFAYFLGKETSNVVFWGVTVVDSPAEITGVRLAVGSNAGSVWWVNGREVVGIYGDRQTQIDDGVSKKLTLKKGPNVVRCLIVNNRGMVDFCARFLDADDNPISRLTVLPPAALAASR